jgi:hypothetical protein
MNRATEISKLHTVVRSQQNIFWLNVPMYYEPLVHECHCTRYLRHIIGGGGFIQTSCVSDKSKQFTVCGILYKRKMEQKIKCRNSRL